MTINSEQIMAIVRLVIPCAAGVAAVFGWSLDGELAANIIISVLAVATFIWSWWKNNNITSAAQDAQLILDEIKQSNKEAKHARE